MNKFSKFISTSVSSDFNEAVAIAKRLNCGLEISRFPDFWNIDDNFDDSLGMMKQALVGFKGELSLHGFFFELCIASSDKAIRAISAKRFQQAFDAAKALGAKTVVYHTGYNAPIRHHDYKDLMTTRMKAFYKDFIPQFEQAGITAVLENIQEFNPEFVKGLIEYVNSPNLKASIDVGHANIHSQMDVVAWINGFGKNLYHMHLHNNFGTNDDHFSILNGSIDFNRVFEAIDRNGVEPKIVFEIFSEREVVESIEYFDKYFAKDRCGAER